MKTALFTPCFLEGSDPSGSPRLERNLRYIAYYEAIQEQLGFDEIWMADNASPPEFLLQLPSSVRVHGFSERLTGGGGYNYPYCWRALYFINDLIEMGFEKIITIDSDCFILSKGMAAYIKGLDSDWTTFWVPKYRFPSAEVHILCRDAFPLFQEFTTPHYMAHNGKCMETALPFTHVSRISYCDRWGEDRRPQEPGMDAYFQAPVDISLQFEK